MADRYIFSLASNPFYLWLLCTIFYEAGEKRRDTLLFKKRANLYTLVTNLKSKSNDPRLVTLSINVPGIICSSGRFFLDSPEIFFTAAGL